MHIQVLYCCVCVHFKVL